MTIVHQTFYAPIDGILKLERLKGDISTGKALRYMFNYMIKQSDEFLIGVIQEGKEVEKATKSKV